MQTKFVNLEIKLPLIPELIEKAIESKLLEYGKPLRWAITNVDRETRNANIEAIVTE